MKINPTKESVIKSATSLFYQKGFAGTSVRDIAEKANVNVSLISYYFKSKQGLLEYAVTEFYENYLQILEESIVETSNLSELEQLKSLVSSIIQYKQKNHQLTSFIHRELSLDSIFVREMAVTYLAKENHIISKAFFNALKANKNFNGDRHLLLMQLKGMLVTPYVMQNEWRTQMSGPSSEELFAQRYVSIISDWIDFVTLKRSSGAINIVP